MGKARMGKAKYPQDHPSRSSSQTRGRSTRSHYHGSTHETPKRSTRWSTHVDKATIGKGSLSFATRWASSHRRWSAHDGTADITKIHWRSSSTSRNRWSTHDGSPDIAKVRWWPPAFTSSLLGGCERSTTHTSSFHCRREWSSTYTSSLFGRCWCWCATNKASLFGSRWCWCASVTSSFHGPTRRAPSKRAAWPSRSHDASFSFSSSSSANQQQQQSSSLVIPGSL